MNNSGPRCKCSLLERRLNTDILWCVVLLIVMCLTAAIGWHHQQMTQHTALTPLESEWGAIQRSCSAVTVYQVMDSGCVT